MNHSIYSADRRTHVKIVVIALMASIGIAGFGIGVRLNSSDGYSPTAHIIKTQTRMQNQQFAFVLPSL